MGPQPLMLPVRFNMLFICINGFFITRLLLERREIELNDTEQKLWESTFSGYMTKVQMQNLLGLGHLMDYPQSVVNASAGESKSGRLLLVIEGQVSIRGDSGLEISSVGPGSFVGEFQFLRDEAKERKNVGKDRESVTTVFSSETKVVEWDVHELSQQLRNRSDVRHGLESLFATKMANKLRRMNTSSPEKGYMNVLGGILASGTVGEAELAYLSHFRESHGITSEFHFSALRRLGCSEKDFSDLIDWARVQAYTNFLQGIIADHKIGQDEIECLAKYCLTHGISPAAHEVALQHLGITKQDFEDFLRKGRGT